MEVLVLVLRPRVLVLVLTKKSYLHHWMRLMYDDHQSISHILFANRKSCIQ